MLEHFASTFVALLTIHADTGAGETQTDPVCGVIHSRPSTI